MLTIAGLVFLAIACFAFVRILVEIFDWVVGVSRTRGEVADAPEFVPGGPISAGEPYLLDGPIELPPCGMRLVLTEEQVEASFAEIEKNFSVKPRENR